MKKSQILPNRQEYRASFRKFKKLRSLGKKKAKGAFGKSTGFLGLYKSLKVIQLHKRDETHNKFGVVKHSK